MQRIVYLSWPASEIAGGIKMAFRHVEGLRQAGFPACIATEDAKPPTWFPTTAPVLPFTELARERDLLVFPENHHGYLDAFSSWPNRKVVFCQNHFMVCLGLRERRDYKDFGVGDIICPSHETAAFCRRRSPLSNIHIVACPLDSQLFHPRHPKRLQIAYAPPKRPLEARFIHDLFCSDNPGFRSIPWTPIAGQPEQEVARVLGESVLYLSLCRFEAFGLLTLEALASGCVAAGFTGFGAREYATSKNGFWAAEDDCINCVEQLTQAVRLVCEGGDRYRRLLDGACHTAEYYRPDRFTTQLTGCWQTILAGPAGTGAASPLAGKGAGG